MTKFQFALLKSIRNRITATLVIGVTLLLLLFGYFVIHDQERQIRQDALSEVRTTGALLQSTINRMLRHDRAHFVHDILAELHVNPKIRLALLVNEEGRVEYAYHEHYRDKPISELVAGSNMQHLKETISSEASIYHFDEAHRKYLAYIPITPQLEDVLHKKTHVLIIDYQLAREWYHSIATRKLELLSLILTTIAIGVAAWFYFDKLITRRLSVITEALSAIGHGENIPDVAVQGDDEIATVARALELMSAERHRNEAALAKLSAAVEQSWDSIVITNLDAEIEYVNEAFSRNTGYSKEEVLGENPRILQSGTTSKSTYKEMWDTLTRGKVWTGELSNKTKDGTVYYEYVTITPLHDSYGNVINYLGIKKNISEHKQLEEENKRTARALDSFFEQPLNMHLIAKRDGTIVRINPGWRAILGYDENELVGCNAYTLIHPDDAGASEKVIEDLNKGVSTSHYKTRYRHKDGTYKTLEWSASSVPDDDLVFAIAIDITDRTNAEQKVRNLAYFDQLTGLPNKTYLVDSLRSTLESTSGSQAYGVAFVIDIDDFQRINDARGYDFGDSLLKELSRRIDEVKHDGCLLAHVSDDVFFGTTPMRFSNKGEAHRHMNAMAQDILALSNRPVIAYGEEISFSVSIGATVYPDGDFQDVDAILRQAETALHHAKKMGGNQHVSYKDAIGNQVKRTYEVEKELRYAIANDELRMYLQPQVDYQGNIVGVEALVRWQHPQKGLVMPGAFVPIAERSDIIVDLDNWMLLHALDFIAKNDAGGRAITISVNVSPRHFRKLGFTPWLKDAIATAGADPNQLILEVTEGLFLDNLSDTVAKMDELRSLGIRFSIDDFGTGYSSLSYLKRLPVHELKIDRSFINDLPDDQSDANLVKTILMVAGNLGLQVVAEGVETQQQADFLNAIMGITYQGYLYGKPLSLDEWYAQHSA